MRKAIYGNLLASYAFQKIGIFCETKFSPLSLNTAPTTKNPNIFINLHIWDN
jgi:hypothetical protein